MFHLLIEQANPLALRLCEKTAKRFWFFWPHLPKKGIIPLENRKREHHHGIFHIQVIFGTKFQFFYFSLKFWFFGPHFTKKDISNRKQKSEHHHWILHIWISLSTKFQVKLTVLIFWTKFALKGYFQSIFELGWVPNFSLSWKLWFFGPNLPKKGVSGQKQKS